jgi:hypothetical protein
MSVIDGTTINVINTIPTSANAQFGAIGIIGHMASGVVPDPATPGSFIVYKGSTTPGAERWHQFGSTTMGTVYEFNDWAAVVNKFGMLPPLATTAWINGTFANAGQDISSYDSEFNLLRSLELIYLANPSAKTFVAVLAASGASASGAAASAGVSTALTALKKYDEISFLHGAGMDFNGTIQSSALDSSNSTNKAERIYVGGMSIQRILASGSLVPDLTASAGQTTNWSTLKESNGRSFAIATNVNYIFQSEQPDANGIRLTREIGGNFFSSYVLGMISSRPEHITLLREGTQGFNQVYNGQNFVWSKSDETSLINGNVFHIRRSGGMTSFSRYLTYSTASGQYRNMTVRRVVDRIIKEVRAVGDTYVNQIDNAQNRSNLKFALERKLDYLQQLGMLVEKAKVAISQIIGQVAVEVTISVRVSKEMEFININLIVGL